MMELQSEIDNEHSRAKFAGKVFLVEMTREGWEHFEPPFRGTCGIHKCNAPFKIPRPGGDEGPKWDDQNNEIYHRLAVACAVSTLATAIVGKHLDAEDGIAAFNELKAKCVGDSGANTIVSYLIQLFELPHFETVDELLAEHLRITKRLLDIGIEDVKVVYKMHLLAKLRDHEKYGHVEEKCCEEGVSYEETIKAVNARTSRLNLDEKLPQTVADRAVAARAVNISGSRFRSHKSYKSIKQKGRCYKCGNRDHYVEDCPHAKQSEHSESDTEPEHKRLDYVKARAAKSLKKKIAKAQIALAELDSSSECTDDDLGIVV